MRCSAVSFFLIGIGVASNTLGLDPAPTDLYVRVVDVGAGHCAVVKMPGNYFMVYDAGNYEDSGATCVAAAWNIVPPNEPIDFMVLSHSDADHLGGVKAILDVYTVKTVLRTGVYRETVTWRESYNAIMYERYDPGFGDGEKFTDLSLEHAAVHPGSTFRFGDTWVTVVIGYHEPPADWPPLSLSNRRNAVSIVIRIVYAGRSVLLTGDTVGRQIDDPPDVCIAAEKAMVQASAAIPIDSDVLVAPHHGADNGSSTAFIQAVNPEYVIFPAGHKHQHPRASTAQRYLDAGLTLSKMFRTDRGDDEGDKEWDHGRIVGHVDPKGDDDVDIIITIDGDVQVAYRNSP
jgi:competence protein ComEC